jgi:hypothetical protein
MSNEVFPTNKFLTTGAILMGLSLGVAHGDALFQKEISNTKTIDNIYSNLVKKDFAFNSKFPSKVEVYSQTVAIDGEIQKDLTISSISENNSTRYVISVFTPLVNTYSKGIPNLSAISISVGGYDGNPYTRSTFEQQNYYYFDMLKTSGFWSINKFGYNLLGNEKIPKRYKLTIGDNTKLSQKEKLVLREVISQAQSVISSAKEGLNVKHHGSQIILKS